MTKTPKRIHKSKKHRIKRVKSNKVKLVGDGGFARRVQRPKRQGKKVKSLLIRVDADFADWCRSRAEVEGSMTEVTRKLYQQIRETESAMLTGALKAAYPGASLGVAR